MKKIVILLTMLFGATMAMLVHADVQNASDSTQQATQPQTGSTTNSQQPDSTQQGSSATDHGAANTGTGTNAGSSTNDSTDDEDTQS